MIAKMAPMKLMASALLMICLNAWASEEFGVEEDFKRRVPVPSIIASQIASETDFALACGDEARIEKSLEATSIALNNVATTILIKPSAWCMCGAYACPLWIYQVNKNGYQRILKEPGAVAIQTMDKMTNGYREIRTRSGSAGHSAESTYAWNGKAYKVIKSKIKMAEEEWK